MFKGNNIASRISKVIKARIAEAQAEFDEFCKDADTKLENNIQTLRTNTKNEKESKADQLVSTILK